MARKAISDQWLFVLLFTGCVPAGLGSNCSPGMTGPSCSEYDYAFNKPANQKYWLHSTDQARYPTNAVDGDPNQCSATDHISDPWWYVDLQNTFYVEGVKLTPEPSDLDNFKIFTIETTISLDVSWTMCYKHNETYAPSSPIDAMCRDTNLTNYVRVTIYHPPLPTTTDNNPNTINTDMTLRLCNVGVYGVYTTTTTTSTETSRSPPFQKCNEGDFGDYCMERCGDCFNETTCSKDDGFCPPTGACEPGFVSPTCKEKCPNGTYGEACKSTCGNCRNNADCNVFDGSCPLVDECHDDSGCPELYRCQLGYKEPLCDTFCDDYTYGYGCLPCGHCINGDMCERVSGTCPGQCQAGYKRPYRNEQCIIPCDDGYSGDGCGDICGNCWNSTRQASVPCNKTTGLCDDTCAPGYKKTTKCDSRITICLVWPSACELGTYGHNCQGTCGHCGWMSSGTLKEEPCAPDTGTCTGGCMMGWQGGDCKEMCTKGTWALNCDMSCMHCSDCNITTGVCVKGTCIPGWKGDLCNQECENGTYGQYCGHSCPDNCADHLSCDKADGSCNCKDGWTGKLCTEECQSRHWGDSCSQQCGHCADGGGCRQSDGQCLQGCAQDWQGPRCTIIVAPSEYQAEYGAIIGGTIGGFIALVLIGILVAYIVWSWRTGTPMNPQEFVRAARRSLRASQKFARSSIDRLSMRRRRQQQERQKLAKNGVLEHHNGGIEVVDISADISERIYDCVGLPSNTIHADDFQRIYLQLQQVDGHGRTAIYGAFQTFQSLLTESYGGETDGSDNKAFYNGREGNEVHLETSNEGPKFLPLGSNLSGFLLVQSSASSDTVWQHVQQRQIETVITIGKVASVAWKPRERVTIGNDTIECVNAQTLSSHTEAKLTIRKLNAEARRAIRHYEVTLWDGGRVPNVATLLMFIDRFQQISSAQRGRSILVNYVSLRDEAVTFTIIASALALMSEGKRVDILRAVNMGGSMAAKALAKFETFKYLHDVFFQYTGMEVRKQEKSAESRETNKRGLPQGISLGRDTGSTPGAMQFTTRAPPADTTQARNGRPATQFRPPAESSHTTQGGPPSATMQSKNRRPTEHHGHYPPSANMQSKNRVPADSRGPPPATMQAQHQEAMQPKQRGPPADSAHMKQHGPSPQDNMPTRHRGNPADSHARSPPLETMPTRQRGPPVESSGPLPEITPRRHRGPPADPTHVRQHGPPPLDTMQNKHSGPPAEYSRTPISPRGPPISPHITQQAPTANNTQNRNRGPAAEYTQSRNRGPAAEYTQSRNRGPNADYHDYTPLDHNISRVPPADNTQHRNRGSPADNVLVLNTEYTPDAMTDTMI